MPRIKNKTTQNLCFVGPDGSCVAIKPEKSGTVSDALWDHNKDKLCVQALLEARGVLVINEPDTAAIAPSAPSPDAEANAWVAMHWKKAKKLIDSETDTSPLYKLLEDEERPKIKNMLETRIEELEVEPQELDTF